jgi:transcriptional regulator with XRE-family HTH domain
MSDTAHEWPLGERVREARGEESHKSVARRAGIGAETVWQIENGRRRAVGPFSRPKPDTIAKLARALGIPVSEALTLAGYNPENYVNLLDEGVETALARKMAKLQPEEQRALEILVDGLLVARGHMSAGGGATVDVVVRSAGEEVKTDVQSHGEPVNGAVPSRQPQED